MTANKPLYIHEFSTGIKPDGNSDNWISRGFTGQYMNSTLPEIPYNVERSIANDEFKVAENVDKDAPSMVGRVVLASGGANDWSVVAVITRGKDEYVRSLTVSRYFLAEGADSLPKIVAWINFRAKQGRLPIYNPFELKTVGKPNTGAAPIVKTDIKSDMEEYLRNSSTPLIVSPDSYTFPTLDSLACRKSELNGQPASWAYNVEDLAKPERFQIILPASDRVLNLIQQALATKPKEQAASAIDEKALKQAIKGLADNPTVNPKQWQTFVENIFVVASAFPDPDKVSNYWRRLFDGQGASNAIKQGIYTQPMIRLLTIRAIALPETLPDFLQWLQVDTTKKNKGGSYSEKSLEFQAQLSRFSEEPRLKEILLKGTRDLIGKVLMKTVSSENAAWLFLSSQSFWWNIGIQTRNEFRHDIEVLGNSSRDGFIISGKLWDKIWREIQPYWRGSSQSFDEKYFPLADFFYRLKDYFISAHFYQLSCGQVPSKIFIQAFPGRKGLINSNGLLIRQQGYNERGERAIVPIPFVAAIAVLMLSIGFGGSLLVRNFQLQASLTNHTIDKENLDKAVDEFEKTKESLKSIIDELSKTQSDIKSKDKVSSIILRKSELQFCVIYESTQPCPNSRQNKENWVKAIYNYQIANNLPQPDGIISKPIKSNPLDLNTYNAIIKDIERQPCVNPNDCYAVPSPPQ